MNNTWIYRTFPGIGVKKVTIDGTVTCPKCGRTFRRIVGEWFKFCPECGTIMDGGETDGQ